MTALANAVVYFVFDVVGSIILLTVLPTHIRIGNYGLAALTVWCLVFNITTATSALLYRHSDEFSVFVVMPVHSVQWCDWALAFQSTAGIGQTGSILAIVLRLYAAVKGFPKLHRRPFLLEYWPEIVFTAVVPLAFQLLQYVVQVHRANIIEGIGCIQPTAITVGYVFVSGAWAPLLASAAAVYAILTLSIVARHNRRSSSTMFSDNLRRSGHQPNTFIRLLLVTVIILLYTVPVTIAAFCYTMASVDKVPTTMPWKVIHENFNIMFIQRSSTVTKHQFWFKWTDLWTRMMSSWVVIIVFFIWYSRSSAQHAVFPKTGFSVLRRRIALYFNKKNEQHQKLKQQHYEQYEQQQLQQRQQQQLEQQKPSVSSDPTDTIQVVVEREEDLVKLRSQDSA